MPWGESASDMGSAPSCSLTWSRPHVLHQGKALEFNTHCCMPSAFLCERWSGAGGRGLRQTRLTEPGSRAMDLTPGALSFGRKRAALPLEAVPGAAGSWHKGLELRVWV